MIVYKRIYDLAEYDREILKRYNLDKKIYVYVGSTTISMSQRNANWKYEILNNRNYVSSEIRSFLDSLKKFYRYELNMLAEEVEKEIFYNYTVVAEVSNYNVLRRIERELNAAYIVIEYTSNKLKLLSKHDTSLKIQGGEIILKRNKNVRVSTKESVIIRNEHRKNTLALDGKSAF